MSASPVTATPPPDTPAESLISRPPRPNTPITYKAQGTKMYGFSDKDAKHLHQEYGLDAIKFLVGPMKPQHFLDSFFPPTGNASDMPSFRNAFKDIDLHTNVENDMYAPLAEALNMGLNKKTSTLESRCPGYQIAVTAHHAEGGRILGATIPDFCMYRKPDIPNLSTDDGECRSHLGVAEVFFEFKPDEFPDFCTDLPEGVARDAHNFVLNIADPDKRRDAQASLGQNVHYATDVLARQHRTCCFSVIFHGPNARLIRWDRAGAIVTEAFNIKEKPEYLCRFLWRYAHGSEQARGYDTTVLSATKEEEEIFKNEVTKHVKLQLPITSGLSKKAQQAALDTAVSQHYERGRVSSIAVVEQGATSGDNVHRYFVSKPVSQPVSVASRATRGYWAVSAETHEIAFLKDTWRFDVDQMEREGDITKQLIDAKVKNIPTMLHHGDVPVALPEPADSEEKLKKGKSKGRKNPYQITRTDEFCDADWACLQKRQYSVSIIPHRHYRLVLGTVGYPLETLTGTHELLHATFDAFEAMIDAYKEAGMLHRDISTGNILLVRYKEGEARRGCLIDWELAAPVNRDTSPRQYERTGTWQFMSINMLKQAEFVHSIQDDMESMLYVVLYSGLRWLPHNLEAGPLTKTLRKFFDEVEIVQDGTGRVEGGDAKFINQYLRSTTRIIHFTCKYFQEWLTTVMNFHSPVGPGDKVKYAGKWEGPNDLHQFWKDFLDIRALPQGDKKINALVEKKAQPMDTRPLQATNSLSQGQFEIRPKAAMAAAPRAIESADAVLLSNTPVSQRQGSKPSSNTGYFLRSSKLSGPPAGQAQGSRK